MIDDLQPNDADRATVDITVDPDTMLQIRDDLRTSLVRQYHLLLLAARANRKVGNLDVSHRQEDQARRTVRMIWSLDNPMAELTPLEPKRGRATLDAKESE